MLENHYGLVKTNLQKKKESAKILLKQCKKLCYLKHLIAVVTTETGRNMLLVLDVIRVITFYIGSYWPI